MKKISFLVVFFLILGFILFFYSNLKNENDTYSVSEGKLVLESIKDKKLYDIKDVIKTFKVVKFGKLIGNAVVTERQFPNGDSITFVNFDSPKHTNTFTFRIGGESAITKEEMIDTSIKELYPYRKDRKNSDPLSTQLNYFETKQKSFLLGSQVMYKDISHTYAKNDEKSEVFQFLNESHEFDMIQDKLSISLHANNSSASTWIMASEEHLFNNKKEFEYAHKIGVDEFRWITPNATLSHGLSSIYPSHPDAFVRSLVRQSGRSSSIALENNPSRFYENINRNLFKSLEDARNKDGLWHSNYTSTWLAQAYGFGPNYVDSRHNDNIFRSQIRRAELLGYEDYVNNIEVYADFLLEMVKQNYTIQTKNGYLLVDYYDLSEKSLTHTSLNHALSQMNYLYDAYLKTGKEEYLLVANSHLAALNDIGVGWISEDNQVKYQLNLDGTFSGKDYNLVTYYDLLYTKHLLSEIEKPIIPIIDNLIEVKKNNLIERNIEFEEDIHNIEDLIGLIE